LKGPETEDKESAKKDIAALSIAHTLASYDCADLD